MEITVQCKILINRFLVLQIVVFLLMYNNLYSQEDKDWDKLLEQELSNNVVEEISIFKSSKILTGQSVTLIPEKGLDLRIAHRFGEMNKNGNNLLGSNKASTYFGFFYGLTDKINIGFVRANYKQTNYAFVKYLVLKQSTGKTKMPLTLALFANINHTSKKFPNKERNKDFILRLDYSYQILIAKKFSNRFAFQLTPTIVHRNLVETKKENNNLYALGFGAKVAITKRVSFNMEYYWVSNKTSRFGNDFYDPLSLGFDIQLGSHVFQLMLTNAGAMTENNFIGETTSNFFDGDIRLGFNISQTFSLNKKKN